MQTQNEVTSWRARARKHNIWQPPVLLPEDYNFQSEEFPSLDSYQERMKRKEEHLLFIWDYEQQRHFDWAVRIQFGRSLDEIQVEVLIKKFGAEINKRELGRQWHKCPVEEQARWIGTIEQGPQNGNTHSHLLVNFPRRTRLDSWQMQPGPLSFIFTAIGRCKGICPYGDIRFDRLGDEDDVQREASYMLKQSWKGGSLILSQSLHTV